MPIEAVNLRSVQVAAFQIYPGNMAQFFQINGLEGSDELARVGRYLWRKTVPLSDDPAVTGRPARFDLDVTALFKENPGSLFRIVLSINRGNSTYPCPAGGEPVVAEPPLRNMDDAGYERYANWDYDDEGYDYRPGEWEPAQRSLRGRLLLPPLQPRGRRRPQFLRLRHRARGQARAGRHPARRDDRPRHGPAAPRASGSGPITIRTSSSARRPRTGTASPFSPSRTGPSTSRPRAAATSAISASPAKPRCPSATSTSAARSPSGASRAFSTASAACGAPATRSI